MAKRFLWSLLVALAIAAPATAQVVDIPKESRIENFGDGFCAWCSIEMLGRAHDVKELYGLAKNRAKESDFVRWDGGKWVKEPYVWVPTGGNYYVKEGVGGGGEWAVYSKLKSLGVPFRMQWRGNYSHNLIKYAMKKNLGCVFAIEGFDKIKGERWAHAMVLVDFTDKQVMFIDPNDTGKIYTRTRAWFDEKWTGYVVVIERPKNGKIVVVTPDK